LQPLLGQGHRLTARQPDEEEWFGGSRILDATSLRTAPGSCILLTGGRRPFVALSLARFLAQDCRLPGLESWCFDPVRRQG